MRVSVVCVIDDGEEMLRDDNSKLEKKGAQLFVPVVCVIDDGEEMCDDNSEWEMRVSLNWRERNARFSCLCNRRWWRNVVWW